MIFEQSKFSVSSIYWYYWVYLLLQSFPFLLLTLSVFFWVNSISMPMNDDTHLKYKIYTTSFCFVFNNFSLSFFFSYLGHCWLFNADFLLVLLLAFDIFSQIIKSWAFSFKTSSKYVFLQVVPVLIIFLKFSCKFWCMLSFLSFFGGKSE